MPETHIITLVHLNAITAKMDDSQQLIDESRSALPEYTFSTKLDVAQLRLDAQRVIIEDLKRIAANS